MQNREGADTSRGSRPYKANVNQQTKHGTFSGLMM